MRIRILKKGISKHMNICMNGSRYIKYYEIFKWMLITFLEIIFPKYTLINMTNFSKLVFRFLVNFKHCQIFSYTSPISGRQCQRRQSIYYVSICVVHDVAAKSDRGIVRHCQFYIVSCVIQWFWVIFTNSLPKYWLPNNNIPCYLKSFYCPEFYYYSCKTKTSSNGLELPVFDIISLTCKYFLRCKSIVN